jgi:hypothetical protein
MLCFLLPIKLFISFVLDQTKAGAFWNAGNCRRAEIPAGLVLFFRGGASGFFSPTDIFNQKLAFMS